MIFKLPFHWFRLKWSHGFWRIYQSYKIIKSILLDELVIFFFGKMHITEVVNSHVCDEWMRQT